MSDYKLDIENGKWGNKKVEIIDFETGEILKPKMVYIAKAGNVGPNMSLDDKEINHKSYSIMSNQDTGKIALVMDSVKSLELQKGIEYLGDVLKKLKIYLVIWLQLFLIFAKQFCL